MKIFFVWPFKYDNIMESLSGSPESFEFYSRLIERTDIIITTNYNEADLLTCFSNDYGYERWIEKAIEFYGDSKDILILISSSGKSSNMINACKAAKTKKISKIITLTGHEKGNPLSKLGDINLWIDSKAYNFIENTHQLWLLTVCDLIIGKREYLPN